MTTIPVHSVGHDWQAFVTWFAKSPIASFLRTFTATVLTLMLADWSSAGAVSFDKWQSWAIAACAAALPVILRWINPQDAAFGTAKNSTAP
jgi:hypothetical protein